MRFKCGSLIQLSGAFDLGLRWVIRELRSCLCKQEIYIEDIYILRHWQDKEGDNWKMSLKNIRTKENRYFGSKASLFSFLEDLVEDTLGKQGP